MPKFWSLISWIRLTRLKMVMRRVQKTSKRFVLQQVCAPKKWKNISSLDSHRVGKTISCQNVKTPLLGFDWQVMKYYCSSGRYQKTSKRFVFQQVFLTKKSKNVSSLEFFISWIWLTKHEMLMQLRKRPKDLKTFRFTTSLFTKKVEKRLFVRFSSSWKND